MQVIIADSSSAVRANAKVGRTLVRPIARTYFRPDVIARPSGSTVTEGYHTE